jgi:sugar phosphate isomerase/epimerase
MLSVGVFNGYYPFTLKESVKKIKEDGFTCVQLDLCFKDMEIDFDNLDPQTCKKISQAFRDENLLIAAITADVNLLTPELDKRARNIRKLKNLLKVSHDLGCSYVVSEVGTYHPEHDWTDHTKNKTEEGYMEMLDIITDIVKHAYDYGATYLIEPFINNVIYSIEALQRLFSDINHKSLGLLMDPANLYDTEKINDPDIFLNQIMDALGDKTRVAHVKDCCLAASEKAVHADLDASEGHTFRGVGGIALPAAGLGVMNYNIYLERLYRVNPNMPIMIEHVDEGDMARAKRFIDDKLKECCC